ncbi:MAG: hypothetical protein U0531_14860 [Dehalococcoidia bacterium]
MGDCEGAGQPDTLGGVRPAAWPRDEGGTTMVTRQELHRLLDEIPDRGGGPPGAAWAR